MGAQITILCFYAINLLLIAILDGQPKTGKHSLSVAMLSVAINAGIMWWGGFWQPLMGG